MARAILKKDFKDGDKLYGQQLNNNFGTIEAALDAMNKIAWQDDPDESVTAFRGTTEQIQSQPIIDGQLLYDISTGETYTDYNGERVSTGSGNAIHIGADTPENEATQLWIDPTEDIQSATEIESGSNENGNWVKYSDGTMICTKQLSGSASFSVWFSPIYIADVSAGSWAQSFVSLKSVVGTNSTSQTSVFAIYEPTITSAGTARIINIANSTGTKSYNLNIVAIGRWK